MAGRCNILQRDLMQVKNVISQKEISTTDKCKAIIYTWYVTGGMCGLMKYDMWCVICRLWRVPVLSRRYPIAGRCSILQRDRLQVKKAKSQKEISTTDKCKAIVYTWYVTSGMCGVVYDT